MSGRNISFTMLGAMWLSLSCDQLSESQSRSKMNGGSSGSEVIKTQLPPYESETVTIDPSLTQEVKDSYGNRIVLSPNTFSEVVTVTLRRVSMETEPDLDIILESAPLSAIRIEMVSSNGRILSTSQLLKPYVVEQMIETSEPTLTTEIKGLDVGQSPPEPFTITNNNVVVESAAALVATNRLLVRYSVQLPQVLLAVPSSPNESASPTFTYTNLETADATVAAGTNFNLEYAATSPSGEGGIKLYVNTTNSNCSNSLDGWQSLNSQLLSVASLSYSIATQTLSAGEYYVCAKVQVNSSDNGAGYFVSKKRLRVLPAPADPTGFAAAPQVRSVNLTWNNSSSGNTGFLIFRGVGPCPNEKPVDRHAYNVGDTLANREVIYKGSGTEYLDTTAASHISYCYALFAYDALLRYSAGSFPANTATTIPLPRGKVFRYARVVVPKVTGNATYVQIASLQLQSAGSWLANAMTSDSTGTIGGMAVTSNHLVSMWAPDAAFKAFDSDPANTSYTSGSGRYDSSGNVSGESEGVQVDFGSGAGISPTGFRIRGGAAASSPLNYTFQFSEDSSNWYSMPEEIQNTFTEREHTWSNVVPAASDLPGTPQNAGSNTDMFGNNISIAHSTAIWENRGSGILVVRSTSNITWSPTNGVDYQDGHVVGSGATVVRNAATTTFTDARAYLFNGQTYYYKVWATDSLKRYSADGLAFALNYYNYRCPDRIQSSMLTVGSLTCTCFVEQAYYDGGSPLVWGSSPYRFGSSVCLSARHMGIITNVGGAVTAVTAGSQSSFTGTVANGVTTLDFSNPDDGFTVQ